MTKTSFEDALILSAIRTARFLVRILPYRASLAIGAFVGDLAYAFSKRRAVMLKNLRAVFAGKKSPAEMDRIARESFRNLGRAGIELLRAPDMDRVFVEKHVRVVGREKVDQALKEGKGIIFLTAHFGSWELLSISGALLGYPMTALAREQKHPRSDAYLNYLRRSKGTQVIHKGMPVREILRALKAGRIVGILSDQDGGKTGAFVNFFGRLSSYPKGVAAFTLRTGAPIFPTFIFREGLENHRIEVEGPLVFPPKDLSEEEKEKGMLEQFAAILETKIKKDPAQWLWAHRRWKSTPDRFVLVLSDGKAGHRNQSLALYDAIVRERAAESRLQGTTHLKLIEVRFKNEISRRAFRALYQWCRGHAPWPRFWAKNILSPASYHEIMNTYADIVISAGSSVAGVNLWAAGENAARSVALMHPGISPRVFGAVVAPLHDRLKGGDNVYRTRGAVTRISPEKLAHEAEALRAELSLDGTRKTVGVLIGGDTTGVRFDEALFIRAVDAIARAVAEKDLSVLATTSRRTPSWADEAMKRRFGSDERCPLLVIANEANRAGIVQAILGLSDVAIVSGESISMVSEAVSSGRKVIVIEPFKGTQMKKKHRSFLDQMQKDGLIVRATPESLGSVMQSALSAAGGPGTGSAADQEVLRQVAQKISR